jgi:hypothetical protein
MLSDSYYNMCLDINDDMLSGDMCVATETWYARKTNERNNCRILYDVANAFDLNVPIMSDPYSYDHSSIVAATTDTIHSDICMQKNGMVTVLNNCADTTTSRNGILYNMHPTEVFPHTLGQVAIYGYLTSCFRVYGSSRGRSRRIRQ